MNLSKDKLNESLKDNWKLFEKKELKLVSNNFKRYNLYYLRKNKYTSSNLDGIYKFMKDNNLIRVIGRCNNEQKNGVD